MKKWNLTLAVRIVAGVLFMIFAMGTLLGVGACVALFQYNAFNDDGAELFNEAADYLMDFGDVSELQHLFESNWSYWGDSQVKDKYLTSNLMANHTNFRFRVCNEAGEELISNYSDQHLVAVRDMDWALNCAIDGEQQVIHERYASLEEANQAARDHYEQLKANDYWYTVDREDEGPWLLTVQYTPREYHTAQELENLMTRVQNILWDYREGTDGYYIIEDRTLLVRMQELVDQAEQTVCVTLHYIYIFGDTFATQYLI